MTAYLDAFAEHYCEPWRVQRIERRGMELVVMLTLPWYVDDLVRAHLMEFTKTLVRSRRGSLTIRPRQ